MCFMCVYKITPEDEREALVEAFFNASCDVLNECTSAESSPESDARFEAKAQILSDFIRGRMLGSDAGVSRLSSILTELFASAMKDGDGTVDFTKLQGKPVMVAVKVNSGDSVEEIQAKTKRAMEGHFPKEPHNVGSVDKLGVDFEFPSNVYPLNTTKH